SVLIPSIPWWAFSLLGWAVIAVLSHHKISLSAKVLGIALTSEAGILLILAVAILVIGGPEGVDLHSFEPSSIFAGNSTGAMFAIVFGAFLGFESTAIYTEEARDPHKTVPRAIYLAIGFLGLFYTFISWTIYLAYGRSEIVLAAVADPAGLVFGALDTYLGSWAVLLCEILIVISAFASALAFHNTAIRYLHTLGREGMLPTKLARVHPTHGSPSSANVLLS
ncbi:amino acid transporter, partial [Dietzia sp. UCD-THP]|uniref:APC family permease n=1 Tax=Dietzia sp. UCD-THP TaxID=1292020 RepID=UPI000370E61C